MGNEISPAVDVSIPTGHVLYVSLLHLDYFQYSCSWTEGAFITSVVSFSCEVFPIRLDAKAISN